MDEHVYLGIKKYIVCINKRTGAEIWRTKLKASQLITLIVDGPLIFAHAKGELFCLSRRDGKIMWRNGLTGLGYGHCIIASEGANSSALQAQHAATAIANTAASNTSSGAS